MSRSHTKHPYTCTGFCKRGNSKRGKIFANRHLRRIFARLTGIFNIKSLDIINNEGSIKLEKIPNGNYYKRFYKSWEIQGDFGASPFPKNEFIDRFIDEYGDYKTTELIWKKIYYFK